MRKNFLTTHKRVKGFRDMTQVLLKPETCYLLISSKPLLYIQKNAFDLYKEKKYSK